MEGSTAVQRSPDETQRLTGRNGGSECTSRRPARLAASLFTHVLALVLLILVSASLKQNFVGEGQALLTWRTFPLHPFLMTLAFGFLAPIGAASWRSYSTLLGLSHGTMKVVHAGCMMLAALIGTLGVIDMWLVHADGAQAQLAKGWAVHFQSAHSWVGIGALGLFLLQAGGGVVVFGLPVVGAKRRSELVEPHRALGAAAAGQAGLISVITGLLSLAGRGDNEASKDLELKWAALVALALCFALALVLRR